MRTVPTAEQVHEAQRLLKPHLQPTRLPKAERLTSLLGAPVYLKLESELPTGSFKPRGALYALLKQRERASFAEVCASSTGNHGAAVAYAAAIAGVRATIFVPERANAVKLKRIAELGARIVETGADLDAAAAAADAHAQRTSAFLLSDVTNADLPAGPATIAVEIMKQQPDIETLIVPVGDTALIRGVAAVAKMQSQPVQVIGVQAERAPSYYNAWRSGQAIATATCDTIADGLATRTPYEPNVEAIRSVVDAMVLVSERQMLDAIRYLILEEHVVAEPAGAAAVAAMLAIGKLDGPAAMLVTGGNLSNDVFDAIPKEAGR